MFSSRRSLVLALALFLGGQAIARDVNRLAQQAVELGWNYFKKGDADVALKRFNQALLIDPHFAPAYFGMAYVYSVQSKFDLAIRYYRKTIEADPGFSHAYSNLGLALVYSGRTAEALPVLKKALELDPTNGDACVNTAVYYFAVGDFRSSWRYVHLAQDNRAVVSPEFLRDLKVKMPEPARQKAPSPPRSALPR